MADQNLLGHPVDPETKALVESLTPAEVGGLLAALIAERRCKMLREAPLYVSIGISSLRIAGEDALADRLAKLNDEIRTIARFDIMKKRGSPL